MSLIPSRGGLVARALVFTALMGILCGAGSAARAQQNLLANGGFENALTGWQTSGAVQRSLYASYVPFGLTGTSPTFGAGFIAFNGGNAAPTGVLQSAAISTVIGQQYRLSFVFGAFNTASGTRTQEIETSVLNAQTGEEDAFLITGNVVSGVTTNLGSIYAENWEVEFTATGTSTLLRFSDTAASTTASSDGFLDNVALVAIGGASAPEPTTAVLALIGGLPLIGAVAARRRRR